MKSVLSYNSPVPILQGGILQQTLNNSKSPPRVDMDDSLNDSFERLNMAN